MKPVAYVIFFKENFFGQVKQRLVSHDPLAYLTPEYRSYVGEDLGMHPYYPITHVIATYVIGFISPAFLYSGLKLVLLTPAKPERTTCACFRFTLIISHTDYS